MKRNDRIRLEAFDRATIIHGSNLSKVSTETMIETARKIEEYLLGTPPMYGYDMAETDFGQVRVQKEMGDLSKVPAFSGAKMHVSDCAVNNAPAYDLGMCDCGKTDGTGPEPNSPQEAETQAAAERIREGFSNLINEADDGEETSDTVSFAVRHIPGAGPVKPAGDHLVARDTWAKSVFADGTSNGGAQDDKI